MDKDQFISELRERLMCLPYDERDKAIRYYEEYFDEAGKENEDKVISELGDIERIAREIIGNSTSTLDSVSKNKYEQKYSEENNYSNTKNDKYNYSYSNNYSTNYDDKKKVGTYRVLWILLAIVGAIVVLPVAVGIIGFILGIIGLVLGLIFSSIGFAISLIFGVVSLPITGIAFVGKILFFLGRGLLGLVLLALIIIGIAYLIKKLVIYLKNKNN